MTARVYAWVPGVAPSLGKRVLGEFEMVVGRGFHNANHLVTIVGRQIAI